LCAAGFVVPGSHSSVATASIVSGAGLVVVAILKPKFREISFGPTGFSATVADDAALGGGAAPMLLDVDTETLNRFAHMVSGDKALARELVEDVLARTRRYQRRIPQDERDAFTLRSLIARLETAAESRWVRGIHPVRRFAEAADDSDEVVQGLQELELRLRMTFLLRALLYLTVDQIAQLLGQPAEAVELDLDEAGEVIRPHVSAGAGPAHA